MCNEELLKYKKKLQQDKPECYIDRAAGFVM